VTSSQPIAPGRRRGGLVWQSIRWRLGSSLVFLLVAVAAVTAATAGPIYLAAADQSVTYATLSTVVPSADGIALQPVQGVTGGSTADLERAIGELPGGSGTAPTDRYGPAIVTVDVSAELLDPTSRQKVAVDIESRTGVCAELDIVAGHCPNANDEVLLSTRSAALLSARVGSRLAPSKNMLVVSGVYEPGNPNAPFWWGENPFPYGTIETSNPREGSIEFVDEAFVTSAGAAREASVLPTTAFGQVPLRSSAIEATQIPHILSQLSSFELSVPSLQLQATSGLPAVLQGVVDQESQMRTIVAAAALELVLLGLLVLYQVAASNAAQRSGDLEIAELRGLSRRSIAILALREPAILLAVATPVGLALGWLLVAMLAPHLFEAGTGASVDGLAVVVAIGTFVAGFGAAAIGSRALVRPSLAREGRSASERRSRRNASIVDLLVVVLAAAAVVELVSTHSSTSGGAPLDPLASLTPGALALVAGILGARLLPLASRVVVRATRWSPRVALGLASRSIMRRAGVARRVVVLVIAVGLLVFSVAGYELADKNRATQASFQVGAPDVLTVRLAPGVDFLQAVDNADPSGGEAMAVAKISANSPTLAVDATRFAAIASWPSGTTTGPSSAAVVAADLHPPSAPEATLANASAIRLKVRLNTAIRPAPELVLNLFDEQNDTSASLVLGAPLHEGTTEEGTSLDYACTLVCRIDSISLQWNPSPNSNVNAVNVPVVLSGVEAGRSGRWVPTDIGLTQPGDWTSETPASSSDQSSSVTLSATGSQVSVSFNAVASTPMPAIGPDDAPSVVPSVVTTTLAALNANPAYPGQFPATGLDGAAITTVARAEASALPGIGDNAALIDLAFAEAKYEGPIGGVTYEVWCHDPPSAALLYRLSDNGVTVLATSTAGEAAESLGHTAPSLAFDMFVLAALGATLLALGAVLFSVASDARRRSLEFAALVAVGVPLRPLRRSLLIEQAVVVVVGVLLGLVAGIVAGQLSLSLLPEFPPGRQGPVLPTSVGTGVAAAVVAAAVVLILLLVGGIVASLLTMRRVRPEDVRSST
jgi:hypothetical protein